MKKPEASQAAVGAIATLQARIRELEDENNELAKEYEKLKKAKDLRERVDSEKLRLLEEETIRRVEEAEKAAEESKNSEKLLQKELRRNEDLRAQIEEVEDELEEFQFKRRKSCSCPSTPSKRSTSSSKYKSPQKKPNSIQAIIADTQYKLYEYEELLGFIFTPPEISPRLTPREEEIVSLIYNNTFSDFLKLKNRTKKKKKTRSRKKKSTNSNSKQEESYNNDDDHFTEEFDSINYNNNQNIMYDDNEENDQLSPYENYQNDQNDENDYDNSNADSNSETDEIIEDLLMTLPDSFTEIFRNYLPPSIFKTIMWMKQLPKRFKKQKIPIKRKTINVLRVALHEISLLNARIAYLERRKFASSSPRRFNSENHRYEIQLLIMSNEMKRFRFD